MDMAVQAKFTEEVKNSLQIESFIYHIIRQDEEEPSLNDQVTLSLEQKEFFEERIRVSSKGTQFMFKHPEVNSTRAECLKILDDEENNLKRVSQSLTLRFFEDHNRSMNDGVFITAVVSVLVNDVRHRLLSFLKVDYSVVYQQKVTDEAGLKTVTLERIVDSLADSPKAMQKWAVVDPTDLFDWDALAAQRGTSAAKKDTEVAISDYFKSFLQVTVKDTGSKLTKESVNIAKRWARSLDKLPDGMVRSDFKARAIHYFENNDQFDTSSFVESVLGAYAAEDMSDAERKEREVLREEHSLSLLESLDQAGIAGQTFTCFPSSIPDGSRRTKIKTGTGLVVTFNGTRDYHNITVESDGDEKVITIRTTQYSEE